MLDDKVTTDRVEAALHAHDRGEFRNVHVSTSGGLVRLTGTVPDQNAKEKATELAQTVHRVKKLQNQLALQR